MKPFPSQRWRSLTRGQLLLSVAVGLLALGVGALLIQSYLNVAATTTAFEMGYLIADLSDIQRGVARLHLETVNNLHSRSVDVAQAEIYRALLENQMRVAIGQAERYPEIASSLGQIRDTLGEFDGLLERLARQPTTGNLVAAQPQIEDVLDRLDRQVRELARREETRFLGTVGSALTSQRRTQTILLVLIFLLMGFGVALALSVRSRVNLQFQSAYDRLQQEVLERKRAEDELRVQNEYLSALHETSVGLMNHLELTELLEAILARAMQLLGAADGFVYVAVEGGRALEMRFGTGRFAPSLGVHMARGEGLSGRVLETGEPLAVADYRTWVGRSPSFAELDVRAIVGVPLHAGEGIVGVLGVAAGEERPRPFGPEEIDLLSRFAHLASIALDNAQLYTQAQTRMREVEALYRADAELYRHLELDEVLQALVDVAVDILGADKSSVMCWDAAEDHMTTVAARGFRPETLQSMRFRPGEGAIGRAMEGGQPVVVADVAADPTVLEGVTLSEGIRSFMHVPIVLDGRTFGVFNVNYMRPRAFGEEERRAAVALAQRAALAIENARLYERSQRAATLEERQRLARELHDAVTQTLFSASLIAEVLPRVWERSQDAGRQRLADLHQLTRGALAEMRALLMELRPAALVETPLTDLLHGLAEATTGRARLPVEVTILGESEPPTDVKVALYRIAQEALNNVVKHAEAGHVAVCLDSTDGHLRLTVRDDGRGFEPGSASPESLGLAIMGERATEVGARVRVETCVGAGTTVEVQWPAEEQDER